jgi:DNA repair protein RecO (recombination protein O)
MKVEHTPCYLLHSRNYRETSLLLEIFSREYGRVSLIAKGAKRNKKGLASTYTLHQKYNLSWVAKSELGTLIDIEPATSYRQLNSLQVMTGFYINELLLRLLHKHESHPELFDSYELTINRLLDDLPEQIVLRYYEKILLQSIGYGVVLDHDVITGEAISEGKCYCYEFDSGPSGVTEKAKSGFMISGKTLLGLHDETLSDNENIKEAKILLRTILNLYLGDKPLASRELYQAYMQNKNAV